MDASLVVKRIHMWLKKYNRGEVTFPPEYLEEYVTNVKSRINKSNIRKFNLRMSNLGRPLCQLQQAKRGTPAHRWNEYQLMYTFMVGDMAELWLILVMQSAGIPIQDYDIPVKYTFGDQEISGTADIMIDDKIWDIKTMSAGSFAKYTNFSGFEDIKKDDPFGYVEQGFAYAAGLGKPFGGWIIMNKNTGDIAISEVPLNYTAQHKESIERSTNIIKKVMATKDTDPIDKQFEPIAEVFNKNPTGNTILHRTCSMCDFKASCWPDAEQRPSIMSMAKKPPMVYYTDIKYDKGDIKNIETQKVSNYEN
jgi:hypothetical protein